MSEEDAGSPMLSSAQIRSWLTMLATRSNPTRQRLATAAILPFLRLPNQNPTAAADFEMGKPEMLKITLLLRTGMHHSDVAEAGTLLLICLIRGTSPAAAVRMATLLTSNAYYEILTTAEDVRNGASLRAAAFRFLAEFVAAGESFAKRFCGVDNKDALAVSGMDVSTRGLQPEYKQIALCFWAVEGLRRTACWPDLRPHMSKGVLEPLAKYMNEICNDDFAKLIEEQYQEYGALIYSSIAGLLRRIVVHSEEAKQTSKDLGTLRSILWLLKRGGSETEKLEAVKAFANIVTEPSTHVDDAIPILLQIITSGDSMFRESAFRGLRNAVVRGGHSAKNRAESEGAINILIKELSNTELPIVEHAMAALREIALLPGTRCRIAEALPTLVSLLDASLPTSTLKKSIIHHCVCTLTNLSIDDVISQQIATIGSEKLFRDLYAILFAGTSIETLRVDTLCLLRNLCIDTPSCLLIASMGSPKLFEILFTGNSDLRRESMAVIRNLLLQNRFCFEEFWEVPGFLDEIIIDLTATNDIRLCRAAIDIVYHYLIKGGPARKKILYEMDFSSALLIPMEEQGEEAGHIAAKCFRILKDYEKSVVQDHWSRIWAEWKEEDASRESAKEAEGQFSKTKFKRGKIQTERGKMDRLLQKKSVALHTQVDANASRRPNFASGANSIKFR